MQKKNWYEMLALVLIATITYLPLIFKIGYLNDDWYLMYDGYVRGASFFHNVYSIDRPLRGYLMEIVFSLFGMNIVYYHLSAFLFRVLSSIGLLWICNQLWQNRKASNLLVAILFLIYPGFLSQLNPIDYQAQIFSLTCGMFSVALTIKAMQTEKLVEKWLYIIFSILLVWVYLGLVEYFIGFEVFRLISVVILFFRNRYKKSTVQVASFLRICGASFIAGVGGFLTWRLFFFEAERKATDISLQLSTLFTSPLTGLWWLNYLIQDIFKVTIVAWALPLNMYAFSLRLRDTFWGFGLAIISVLILQAVFRWGVEKKDEVDEVQDPSRIREQVWVGIGVIVGGIIPIILVNRHVILPEYSRYTLLASIGVVILLSIIFEKISSVSLRMTVLSLFVAIAVLTHYGNSMRAVNETEATRNFWWQVSWRAPQIKDGTTLIVSYPNGALSEDYFIWGPANFIYHPEKQTTNPVEIKLPAAVLTSAAILQITTVGDIETPLRRGNYLERDFGNILVIIQTSSNGCVRVMNGDVPELSSNDEQRLFLVAPFSRLENVMTDVEFHTPPAVVFGEEPEHGWCYYYQKADLARQQRDWQEITNLLKQALDGGYYPEDGLEWMPFLQASAVLGDVDHVRSTAKLVSIDKFMRLQSCAVMTEFMKNESLSEEIKTVIEKNICK